MEHDFNPTNLHINGLIFLLNPKKNYFESIFGIPPKWDFFPKNSVPSVFYP